MLGLRFVRTCTLAAAALCLAAPSIAQTAGGFSSQLDAAEKQLDADIRACRPINVNDYFQLQSQASANIKSAAKAAKAGLPVDTAQISVDAERATRLLERAQTAAGKACPPPNQSQTTRPPPTNPPPPPPPPPPPTQPQTTPQAGGTRPPPPPPPPPPLPPTWPSGEPVSAQDFLSGAEDEAGDAFDDYVDAAFHCDAKGMQEALDELRTLERQAESIMEGADMAGKYSKVSAGKAEDVLESIRSIIRDTRFVILRCPLLPQPKPQTPPSCPTPQPEQPAPKGTSMLPSYQPLNSFAAGMLDYHNELRSRVGTPPLRWNPELAGHAMNYATALSQTGELQHSSRVGREGERENVALAQHGASSAMTMAMNWGNELQYFRPGKFPNSCRGDWTVCSHITQMLWGRTTDVGCGFSMGRYDALVCRYSPPGNADGRHVLALPRGWPCGSDLPSIDTRRRPERGR